MSGIRRILFPIDFSERCAAVRPLVGAMTAKFQACVTLFHAIQTPATFYPSMDTAYVVDFDLNEMRQEAEDKLAFFYGIQPHSSPIGVDVVVVAADPAKSIVDYAERNNVDLIMLPTHGYGKYRRLLLGSITAKVLHDARCAVWTSAHTEDPVLLTHADCQNILCAIDLNPEGAELLRRSVELAGSCAARLRIVHAVPQAEAGASGEDHLRAASQKIASLQRETGTDLEVCLEGGSVSKVVRHTAEHHHADLVIIGRGKLNATLGRLRTHAYSIIRDSPCPVLSF